MILLIDNYDSFSYNLYQLIGSINQDIKVIRNDELSINQIEQLNPSHIIISPGPGATITYAKEIMHGKKSTINIIDETPLFTGLDKNFSAARYHSLAVSRETLSNDLKITAQTADEEIMAIEHKTYPVYGLQFHPESILTKQGDIIIKNFLAIGGGNND